MLTIEQISAMLSYDPNTGFLTWKVKASKRIKIGDIAGCKSSDGRILVGIHGKLYKAHRIAWAITTGKWPQNLIDHINCNPSDNRFENLREATQSQNMMNAGKTKSNTSGVRGVGWSKSSQKWRAYICRDRVHIHLGLFDNVEEARKARVEAAKKYHENFHHDQ